MFRANTSHRQGSLFSTVNELPEAAQKVLANSWANTFYEEVFCRIDEEALAVLYAGQAARPNVPVNVLMSLAIMKQGCGWTEVEMSTNYLFNREVRVALGYESLTDGYFAIRTVYNFRDALNAHMATTGENLLEQAFEQITDEQIAAFGLQTDKQRVDSTQLMSNIRRDSRLTLLVEVLRRVKRLLTKADQQTDAELLAPYVKDETAYYVYGLKSSEYTSHLARIGKVMNQLVSDLGPSYGADEIYITLVRAFSDHFSVAADEAQLIPGAEVKADSLQSPDDPEATDRNKRGESYRGYVVNAFETCNPENDFQLITQTQTASNVTDDAAMLVDAIPNLVERTDLDTCYSDGGYNGPEVDPILAENDITHVQTAIRGGQPDPNQVTISDFILEFDQDGHPVQATCPTGQSLPLEPGRADDRFIGRPDATCCAACPCFPNCTVRPQGNRRSPARSVDKRQALLADKRQALDALPQSERNLRPLIESTMRSLKHPFRHDRVLLRGKFRSACAVIGSAFMANLRRIHRAQQTKNVAPTPAAPACPHITAEMPFCAQFCPQNFLLTATPPLRRPFWALLRNPQASCFSPTMPRQQPFPFG